MVSYFGESTDDSRQPGDDHGDDDDGISGKSPKKISGLKKRPNSAQYAEYELTFDEITDGLFLDKTDEKGAGLSGEKKKKKGGWEKINISKLTSKGSKARAFFSGRRSVSLRSVVTPPQTPSLPATATSSGETMTSTANTISPQVPMSLLSQRLQFQLKQAAQLSRQRLQHQAQSLPSPRPSLQRSFTQPSPPLSPSTPSKIKTSGALTPQGDQSKTVRFTVESFEAGGGSEEQEGETTVKSRRFEKEKYPGKMPGSLTLSASSSSLRIGSPSLLSVTASPSGMSISSTPVSPNVNESTDLGFGIESARTTNLSSMKFSLHKILTPKILRELKLQTQKELQEAKQEEALEKPAPTPTPSTEVLPLPPPSSSTSTTDATTTTTSASTTSGSSTTTNMASTTAPDDTEAVASTSSNTPSFTLASILQLKRQQSSSPTSSRSSAEIATTSEGTTVETMTPGDGGDANTPVPSIYVIGTAPKALPEEIEDPQNSSASPSRQKPSMSSRSSFKSTSKTWARAAARAAAKAATRAAARASAAAAAAASSVKSSSSSSLSSALSSSTSTSSTGLHLHLRSPELRSPIPQTPTPARVSSAVNEEGVAEEAAAQTSDQDQFDIPSAEGMEKVIDNERKIRIRRLQRDLTRIQKELQALDDLEYEVSYVWCRGDNLYQAVVGKDYSHWRRWSGKSKRNKIEIRENTKELQYQWYWYCWLLLLLLFQLPIQTLIKDQRCHYYYDGVDKEDDMKYRDGSRRDR